MQSNNENTPELNKKIRDDLICPISQELMTKPVIAADGHTYEQAFIEQWIKRNPKNAISPLTGAPLEHHQLTPNHTIKKIIDAYLADKPKRKQKKLDELSLTKIIESREKELSALKERTDLLEEKAKVVELREKELSALKERTELSEKKARIAELRREKEIAELKKRTALLEESKNIAEKQTHQISSVKTTALSRPEDLNKKIKLLDAVVNGDLDLVLVSLAETPSFVYARFDITDLSKRVFSNITIFQYSIWASDIEMCEIILNYLPHHIARRQLQELEESRLDITNVYGARFSFDDLIGSYTQYLKNHDSICWSMNIRSYQYELPAWVVYMFTEEGNNTAWTQQEPERAYKRVKSQAYKNWHKQLSPDYDINTAGSLDAFYRWMHSNAMQTSGNYEKFTRKKTNGQEILQFKKRKDITEECASKDNRSKNKKHENQMDLSPIDAFDQHMFILLREYTILRQVRLRKYLITMENQFKANYPNEVSVHQFSKATKDLLTAVIRGDIKSVEQYLKSDKQLVQSKGDITDLSGRTFTQITAFQYAFWAMDIWMCNAILKYLPTEKAAEQIQIFESERQDITKIYGAQFNFNPLVEAYDKYLGRGFRAYWSAVGEEQYKIPAWVIYAFTELGYDSSWCLKNPNKPFSRIGNEAFNSWHKQIKFSVEADALGSAWVSDRATSESGKRFGQACPLPYMMNGMDTTHDIETIKKFNTYLVEQFQIFKQTLTAKKTHQPSELPSTRSAKETQASSNKPIRRQLSAGSIKFFQEVRELAPKEMDAMLEKNPHRANIFSQGKKRDTILGHQVRFLSEVKKPELIDETVEKIKILEKHGADWGMQYDERSQSAKSLLEQVEPDVRAKLGTKP